MAPRLSQRQRAFEILLADLSSRFANVHGNEVERQIEHALRKLIAFFGFDRSSFAEFDAEGRFYVLCSVAVKGVEPFPLGPAPPFLSWYVREARSGKVIAMRSVEDLPPEAAATAEHFRQSGLHSHLGIPIRVGGRIIAGIGFASFTKKQEWVGSLIRRLKLLGEIFALALARKRGDENLTAALAEIVQLKEGRARFPSKDALCSDFGLTPAEAYIALGIVRGETLASLAAARGITIATARTQLKLVFAKLGAHRQSQLVALLSRSMF
jgi:DNA-binding CsgD family transcriptional regulator/GAF domain-containing protein